MLKFYPFQIVLVLLISFLISCGSEQQSSEVRTENTLFNVLKPAETGILFSNLLEEGLNTNILMYEYFYNGGGVVAADFNDDGLMDVYFTANMNPCKLYLNGGNFSFRDISKKAGVEGREGPWKTGATIVDINSDGLPDIYLSYSGALPAEKRKNQLFVNLGVQDGMPVFEDQAEKYGLDLASFTNQAYFFDFDKDGELEVLMLNHNPKNLPLLNEAGTAELFAQDSPDMGLRYLVRQGNKYVDQTPASGINGSVLSYGLGLGIGDFNADGWFDFYVSNDYAVPDYVYINQKGKGFKNEIESYLGHNSQFSMGNDVADLNNDGFEDIVTLDMLPKDDKRQKLLLAPDNYNKYEENKRSGFHHQLMRNMLQMNAGNGRFSEVGQISGISNTDWSWAPLIADFDNDGYKDIYITNGYLRDYTNLDFINYMENYVSQKGRLQRDDVLDIINQMPSSDLVNYMYHNQGNGTFSDVTADWGLAVASNSNGAAYADFDNDGDLDVIVNNLNKEAFVLKNMSTELNKRPYVDLKLKGEANNTLGIGARLIAHAGTSQQTSIQMPARAYLSSVSPILHFAATQSIDSIEVFWNSGKYSKIVKPEKNTLIEIAESESHEFKSYLANAGKSIFAQSAPCPDFTHMQTQIIDYNRQPLMFTSPSYFGPKMIKADLNLDGLEDLVVGGGSGQATAVFLSNNKGYLTEVKSEAISNDKKYHDSNLAVGDFNADGLPDLFVCSGAYGSVMEGDLLLHDRIYLGDGKGKFVKLESFTDDKPIDNHSVVIIDLNKDGKDDIISFSRYKPGRYPESSTGKVYLQTEKGTFEEAFDQFFGVWDKDRNVTDAKLADLDGDGIPELIVLALWENPMIYEISTGKLKDVSSDYLEVKSLKGLWNVMEISDINGDGKADLILGNLGLNTQLKATESEPVEMVYGDFDSNGSVDPILCYYNGGKKFTYAGRDELMSQLPKLKQKFNSYGKYAEAGFDEVMSGEFIKSGSIKSCNVLQSIVLLSQSGSKKLKILNLPFEAQYAPICTILTQDFNRDGHVDLLLMGNDDRVKLRLGKMDANQGLLVIGDGKGGFYPMSQRDSGLKLIGDVRGGAVMGDKIILGLNGKKLQCYAY